jgi:hypothetical protein
MAVTTTAAIAAPTRFNFAPTVRRRLGSDELRSLFRIITRMWSTSARLVGDPPDGRVTLLAPRPLILVPAPGPRSARSAH